MLSNRYRFHGHGSLRYVYKNGDSARSRLITIKYLRNSRRHDSRFSVIVSKKILKRAVGRNRIRRRVYEVIRLELPEIEETFDVAVMIFSNEVLVLPPADLTALIRQLFHQAGLYKK